MKTVGLNIFPYISMAPSRHNTAPLAVRFGDDETAPAKLTQRFIEAFEYASRLHATQVRKGTDTPYVSHLMRVAGIVLDYGGTEDEAIAALLHDAVEDQGGAPVLEVIRRRFGDTVANIVDECTDADVTPKPPWRTRKEAYIAQITHKSASGRKVSAADKLDNARAILSDYQEHGEALWSRFKGRKEGTLWYYRALVTAYQSVEDSPLIRELDRAVTALEQVVKQNSKPN
jgi:(p)ppGpp synthase/HD superfamily hydrolase